MPGTETVRLSNTRKGDSPVKNGRLVLVCATFVLTAVVAASGSVRNAVGASAPMLRASDNHSTLLMARGEPQPNDRRREPEPGDDRGKDGKGHKFASLMARGEPQPGDDRGKDGKGHKVTNSIFLG